jgi:hypothetical protein
LRVFLHFSGVIPWQWLYSCPTVVHDLIKF